MPDTPRRFADPDEMRTWSDERRRGGRRIGLVPTMGALHHGHLALVDAVRAAADEVVVSIFVNPLQFNRADDFDGYPRPIDDDVAACAAAGVDAVYVPTAAVMYPPGFQTHVEPGPLAEPLEGGGRPGHFRGVVTVVTKLFGAVRPHVAAFGEKDFQQLAVVTRLSADLDLGVEILPVPIVREPDGVALSSRNVRLTPSHRDQAPCISRGLDAGEAAVRAGERRAEEIERLVRVEIGRSPDARIEYVSVADVATLLDVEQLDPGAEAAILVAVWFGDVRLIDNRRLATG